MRSITAGLGDLFGLPLAALGRGSPAAFVAGLGTGSASLLRNLSGGNHVLTCLSLPCGHACGTAADAMFETCRSGKTCWPEVRGSRHLLTMTMSRKSGTLQRCGVLPPSIWKRVLDHPIGMAAWS